MYLLLIILIIGVGSTTGENYGSTCSETKPCSFLECIENTCQCNETSSVYSQLKNQCLGLATQHCESSENCTENSFCVWNRCECSPGYKITPAKTCAPLVGSPCMDDNACNFNNHYLICLEGHCTCDPKVSKLETADYNGLEMRGNCAGLPGLTCIEKTCASGATCQFKRSEYSGWLTGDFDEAGSFVCECNPETHLQFPDLIFDNQMDEQKLIPAAVSKSLNSGDSKLNLNPGKKNSSLNSGNSESSLNPGNSKSTINSESTVINENSGSTINAENPGSTINSEHSGSTINSEHFGSTINSEHFGSTINSEHSGSTINSEYSGSTINSEHSGSTINSEYSGLTINSENSRSTINSESTLNHEYSEALNPEDSEPTFDSEDPKPNFNPETTRSINSRNLKSINSQSLKSIRSQSLKRMDSQNLKSRNLRSISSRNLKSTNSRNLKSIYSRSLKSVINPPGGLISTESEQKCLKRPGISCSAHHECYPGLVCRDGNCSCTHSFQTFSNLHRRCMSFVGEPCDSELDCVENSTCSSFGLCLCKKPQIGTKIQENVENCIPATGRNCRKIQCNCPYENQTYSETLNKCLSPPGGDCDEDSVCGENSKCKFNQLNNYYMGKCECVDGFEFNNYGECRVPFAGKCNLTSDCDRDLHCVSGTCQCEFSRVSKGIYNKKSRKCLLLVGSKCGLTENYPCVNNADCVYQSWAEDFVCHCDVGSGKFRISAQNTCKKLMRAGEECNENTVCVDNAYCPHKENAIKNNNRTNICLCKHGFGMVGNGECKQPFWGLCARTKQCESEFTCLEGRCRCRGLSEEVNFNATSKRCELLVGTRCGSDLQYACVNNAECMLEKVSSGFPTCSCDANKYDVSPEKTCKDVKSVTGIFYRTMSYLYDLVHAKNNN